jgi:hypothetical protein
VTSMLRKLSVIALSGLLVFSVGAADFGFGDVVPQMPLFSVPSAQAFSCSPCRRAARELRRARDRIKRELRRAIQRAEREAKRAEVRVKEQAIRSSLDVLNSEAALLVTEYVNSRVSNVVWLLEYHPVGMMVAYATEMLGYERLVEDMESFDMGDEITDSRTRLQGYQQMLTDLESLPVEPSTLNLVSHVRGAPSGSAQSPTTARLRMEQLGQYMSTLMVQALVFQTSNASVPQGRPVTLLYKIGQALIDFEHLKADIRLISDTQSSHSGLYDELITNGTVESVAGLLSGALSYLETMHIGSVSPSPIADLGVLTLIDDLDGWSTMGDDVVASHHEFPLMETPSALIADISTALTDSDFNQTNQQMAWLLLRPQHEIDAVDMARARLIRVRDQLMDLNILTPTEIVGLYFFQALFLSPRISDAQARQAAGEVVAIGPEILDIHDGLVRALDIISARNIALIGQSESVLRSAADGLMVSYNDIERTNASLLPASVSETIVAPTFTTPPLAESPPVSLDAPEVTAEPILPPALHGSAPLVPDNSDIPSIPDSVFRTTDQRALQDEANDLEAELARIQRSATLKGRQLNVYLKRGNEGRIAALLSPEGPLDSRTAVLSEALQLMVDDVRLRSLGSLDAALNNAAFQKRLADKGTAFSDSVSLGVHKEAIENLYSVGLIQGFPDGSFKAERELNRAEMLLLAIQAAYGTEFTVFEKSGGYRGGDSCFADVPRGKWYENAVCFGAEQGVVQGYLDGYFRPADPVTFVEGLRLTISAFELPVTMGGEQWFSNDVAYAGDNGLIPVDFVAYDAPLTRGQMASMLSRAVLLASAGDGNDDLGTILDSDGGALDDVIFAWSTRKLSRPEKPIDLEQARIERLKVELRKPRSEAIEKFLDVGTLKVEELKEVAERVLNKEVFEKRFVQKEDGKLEFLRRLKEEEFTKYESDTNIRIPSASPPVLEMDERESTMKDRATFGSGKEHKADEKAGVEKDKQHLSPGTSAQQLLLQRLYKQFIAQADKMGSSDIVSSLVVKAELVYAKSADNVSRSISALKRLYSDLRKLEISKVSEEDGSSAADTPLQEAKGKISGDSDRSAKKSGTISPEAAVSDDESIEIEKRDLEKESTDEALQNEVLDDAVSDEKKAQLDKQASEKNALLEKQAAEKAAAEEKALLEKQAAEKAAAEEKALLEKQAAEKAAAEAKALLEKQAAEKAAAEEKALLEKQGDKQ